MAACARCIPSRAARHRGRAVSEPLDLGSQPRMAETVTRFVRHPLRFRHGQAGIGFAAVQRHYALAQHIELLFGRSQPPARFALNGGASLDLVDELAAAALLCLDAARAPPLPTSRPSTANSPRRSSRPVRASWRRRPHIARARPAASCSISRRRSSRSRASRSTRASNSRRRLPAPGARPPATRTCSLAALSAPVSCFRSAV